MSSEATPKRGRGRTSSVNIAFWEYDGQRDSPRINLSEDPLGVLCRFFPRDEEVDAEFPGLLVNISKGGAAIRSAIPRGIPLHHLDPEHLTLGVKLLLPNMPPVEASCSVRWIRVLPELASKTELYGEFGVRFEELAPEQKRHLEQYLIRYHLGKKKGS